MLHLNIKSCGRAVLSFNDNAISRGGWLRACTLGVAGLLAAYALQPMSASAQETKLGSSNSTIEAANACVAGADCPTTRMTPISQQTPKLGEAQQIEGRFGPIDRNGPDESRSERNRGRTDSVDDSQGEGVSRE